MHSALNSLAFNVVQKYRDRGARSRIVVRVRRWVVALCNIIVGFREPFKCELVSHQIVRVREIGV